MKGLKPVVYMSLALGMLLYAVPRLDLRDGLTLPGVFGLLWVGFAVVVIAAHLHELLGVDEETKREIAAVKRMRKWRTEQLLQGRKPLRLRK